MSSHNFPRRYFFFGGGIIGKNCMTNELFFLHRSRCTFTTWTLDMHDMTLFVSESLLLVT